MSVVCPLGRARPVTRSVVYALKGWASTSVVDTVVVTARVCVLSKTVKIPHAANIPTVLLRRTVCGEPYTGRLGKKIRMTQAAQVLKVIDILPA